MRNRTLYLRSRQGFHSGAQFRCRYQQNEIHRQTENVVLQPSRHMAVGKVLQTYARTQTQRRRAQVSGRDVSGNAVGQKLKGYLIVIVITLITVFLPSTLSPVAE